MSEGKVPHGQLMRDAWAQAQQQEIALAAERRLRRQPGRVAAREQSRTAFDGLSSVEAARLASQQFPEIVREPAVGPLLRGQVADEYVGRYAARLMGEAPGGRDAFVASSTPLRDPDGSGDLAPVDVSLRPTGDGWAPRNPLEPYAIGADGSVRFTAGGVSVDPTSVDVPGEVVDETVFFADAATDTDALVKPLTDGVQVAWQLRSAASPEALELDVQLPAGVALGEAGVHGVRLLRDGKAVGSISPAIAYDADGKQVEAKLTVDGDRVVVEVAHRDRDLAYPIMVDPEVTAGFYFNYQGHEAFDGSVR